MPYETELAWAAGFFDGEGCATCSTAKYVSLQVKQVERQPLERFLDAVGQGRIFGESDPGEKRSAHIWVWRAQGQAALDVFDRLWPYLSEPKRDQWEHVLARFDACHTRRSRLIRV